jgi:hypothetical protein
LRGSAATAGRGEAGCGGFLAFASARGGDLRESAAPARGLSVVYTAQEERIRGICNSITQSSSSSSSDRGFGSGVEIVLRRVSFRDLTFLYVGES